MQGNLFNNEYYEELRSRRAEQITLLFDYRWYDMMEVVAKNWRSTFWPPTNVHSNGGLSVMPTPPQDWVTHSWYHDSGLTMGTEHGTPRRIASFFGRANRPMGWLTIVNDQPHSSPPKGGLKLTPVPPLPNRICQLQHIDNWHPQEWLENECWNPRIMNCPWHKTRKTRIGM